MDYNVCVVIRHPPYGSVMPAEAYRTIQALQTFEREVSVLFMADGVLTMVDSTDPEPIGMHRLAEAYVALMELPGPRFELCPDLAAGIISANADDLAWIEARIGQKLDSPPQRPAGDTWRIGSDADLKLVAAAFTPMLEGGKPAHRAGDPEQADIAAWKKLSEFIARIPETGGS